MMGAGISAEIPIVRIIGQLVPLPNFRVMFHGVESLQNYGQLAVDNSRARDDSGKNIFRAILDEAEKEGTTLTDADVRNEAGNLIVGGSDSTAVTLTYLTWAILSQPELQSTLEEEVAGLSEDFDDAEAEKLPLLNAAVMEGLRLYTGVPGSLPRAVQKAGATLGGYHIPGGMEVSTQSWTLHRDGSLFPDAEKYVPRQNLSL
jgi:cytochrome P450